MASIFNLCVIFLFVVFISPSIAKISSFKPRTLVLPVTKDSATKQYVTQINQRTPLVSVNLMVDLGGRALWVDCSDDIYVSSSYKPIHCDSKNSCPSDFGFCFDCFDTKPTAGCNNHTCRLFLVNELAQHTANMEVTQDVLSIQSTDGLNPGRVVSTPGFKFGCGQRMTHQMLMLLNLAKGVEGMAGLGRTEIGLPSQLATSFNLTKKFAICLSSSTKASGALFFGDGPYVMHPNVDVSKSLTYTSLAKKRFVSSPTSAHPPSQYFIRVKSIKVNGKVVPVNTTLLNVNDFGKGGTEISTLQPYTVLETSINDVITNAFAKELKHVPTVKPRSPFKLCYDASKFNYTEAGPAVPPIDFVLNKPDIFWRIDGANALVADGLGRLCLAFVDGGLDPDEAIVIGGHQLENHLLQFDLDNSKLGFSSSLLSQGTTCDNFNFKSIH